MNRVNNKRLEELSRDKRIHSGFQVLYAELLSARKVLEDFQDIIDESNGVIGLHLNGDIATWEELQTDFYFHTWLESLPAHQAQFPEEE